MSTAIFPTLPGLGWPVQRQPLFSTRLVESISGKETAIAEWSYPRYSWTLVYNILREGLVNGSTYLELSSLWGFFEARKGRWDSFLFKDQNDNAVTTQNIGVGDGTTVAFQLIRSYGGAAAPVFAPNLGATLNVYLNGTLQSNTTYTVTPWATANTAGPGCIVFNSAPSNGAVITADFQFYWPCRFMNDDCKFEQFMDGRWRSASVAFRSIK